MSVSSADSPQEEVVDVIYGKKKNKNFGWRKSNRINFERVVTGLW